MINILFAAFTERWDQYQQPLRKELDLLGLKYKLSEKLPPSEVDYIIYAPNSSIKDFSVFTSRICICIFLPFLTHIHKRHI